MALGLTPSAASGCWLSSVASTLEPLPASSGLVFEQLAAGDAFSLGVAFFQLLGVYRPAAGEARVFPAAVVVRRG